MVLGNKQPKKSNKMKSNSMQEQVESESGDYCRQLHINKIEKTYEGVQSELNNHHSACLFPPVWEEKKTRQVETECVVTLDARWPKQTFE